MKKMNNKNPHSGIGSSVLLSNNTMVVFGDPPNDDLIVEQKNVKSSIPSLYKKGILQDIEESALDELMSKVKLLYYSDAVCQFNLNLNRLQQIKDSIKKWSCTHIRMFAHQGKLRVLFYDCRMGDMKFRAARKYSLSLHYLDLQVILVNEFTFTFKAKSFVKIPFDDYLVRIGDNSICLLVPSKKDVQYLIRDQEMHEPAITFTSPRLNSDIVFSPAPNL
jgi:hypothetical protein